MAKLQFFPTKTSANSVIGSLSDTSKMPGKSWGISASLCNTGQKLAKVSGTVCSDCYACKGSYKMYPAVAKAHSSRLKSYQSDRLNWCKAMVDMITGQETMRWFDSGDLQSSDMLRDILSIAARTPDTKHWIATREVGFVRDALQGKDLPDNVVIRMSASFPDDSRVPGFELTGNAALVHKNAAPQPLAFQCPAPSQNGKCGECRACWNRSVSAVSYKSH